MCGSSESRGRMLKCAGKFSKDVSHTEVGRRYAMSAILGLMGPGCFNLRSELNNKCLHARKHKLEKAGRATRK